MALIKCPECGKEISDQSNACIHCGCPLKKISIINNIEYDLNDELNLILNGKVIEAVKSIRIKTGLGLANAKKISDYMQFNKTVPSQMTININESSSSNSTPSDVLKCPKCGSTAITTCARGVNGFWGFIGAGKTVNRCGNCGHTWKPRG